MNAYSNWKQSEATYFPSHKPPNQDEQGIRL